MTEGISQGLMILVALIIFGIFVSIIYVTIGGGFDKKLEDSVTDLDNSLNAKEHENIHKLYDLYPTKFMEEKMEINKSESGKMHNISGETVAGIERAFMYFNTKKDTRYLITAKVRNNVDIPLSAQFTYGMGVIASEKTGNELVYYDQPATLTSVDFSTNKTSDFKTYTMTFISRQAGINTLYFDFSKVKDGSTISVDIKDIEISSEVVAGEEINFYSYVKNHYADTLVLGNSSTRFKLNNDPLVSTHSWGLEAPIGFGLNNKEIRINYNQKIEFELEVYMTKDATFISDYNNVTASGFTDFYVGSNDKHWNADGNRENFVTAQNTPSKTMKVTPIKKNTWTKVTGYYENTSPENKAKSPIIDTSHFGVVLKDMQDGSSYIVRNASYKVTDIK